MVLTQDGVTGTLSSEARMFTTGVKDCFISKLKPIIHADGYLYPCCGIQYASGDPQEQRHFPPSFRMGHWRDFHKIGVFDGPGGKKC